MSNQQNEIPRLEVEIFGLTFRMRAPEEEHDRLKRAARHVDNVLRELGQSQSTPDTARQAIQAAFLITHDYIKLMDDLAQQTGLTDERQKRVDDMLAKLDESLKTL